MTVKSFVKTYWKQLGAITLAVAGLLFAMGVIDSDTFAAIGRFFGGGESVP